MKIVRTLLLLALAGAVVLPLVAVGRSVIEIRGSARGPEPFPFRFVALGDTGKGNETQYAVARAIKNRCDAEGGCAFALLLGDNIYPAGITDPDDEQMKEKFEKPYAELPFQFHVVLGNHDYGAAWEFWRADAQLAYARTHWKFHMPDRHYQFFEGYAQFHAVDTNALFWDVSKDETDYFSSANSYRTDAWQIAFGHHPFISNGKHGNAGRYDGIPFGWVPGAGGDLETFFREHVCRKIDLYFAGHDHNLQDLGETCGTNFIVSGAGSSATALSDRNPSLFQASVPGFVMVNVENERLLLRFYDEYEEELHRREIRRKPVALPSHFDQ